MSIKISQLTAYSTPLMTDILPIVDLIAGTTRNITRSNLLGNVYNEVPTGAINGSNVTYTLANTPITGTVRAYVDGVRVNSSNFSIVSKTLTLSVAPTTELVIDYNK